MESLPIQKAFDKISKKCMSLKSDMTELQQRVHLLEYEKVKEMRRAKTLNVSNKGLD